MEGTLPPMSKSSASTRLGVIVRFGLRDTQSAGQAGSWAHSATEHKVKVKSCAARRVSDLRHKVGLPALFFAQESTARSLDA